MNQDSIFYGYRNIFKKITRDFTFTFIDIESVPSDIDGAILSFRKRKTCSLLKCKELKQWIEIESSNGERVTLELLKNHSNELIYHSVIKYNNGANVYKDGVVSELFELKEGGTVRSFIQPSRKINNYYVLVIVISGNKYSGSYMALFDGSEMDDFNYTTEPDNYFV